MAMFPGASPIDIGSTNEGKKITLTPRQRSNHMQVVGSTDTGKSTLLERMIRQDIARGHGLCLIDPAGLLYDKVLGWIAHYGYDKRRHIHLIDPAEEGWRVGFNPLWSPSGDVNEMFDSVDLVLDAFAQAMGGEDILAMPRFLRVCSALTFALAARKLTLLEAFEMLPVDHGKHREWLADGTPDRLVRSVWDELNALKERELSMQLESTFSRMFDVLKAPALRAMVGQTDRVIDFRQVMDRGDIVLVNLKRSRGFSRQAGDALGRMLINSMFNAALEREADASRPFYLYVDECHRYVTEDVEAILSECRKFGLHLILAHQYLKQLELVSERFYHAIMTQARIKVVFAVGRTDAKLLAEEILADRYDLEKPKRSLDKPVLVGHRHVLTRHRLRSETRSKTTGESEADIESLTEALGTGAFAGTGAVVVFDQNGTPTAMSESETAGSSTTQLGSRGTGQMRGRNSSEGAAATTAEGESEALEPILEWMHTAMHTLEELNHQAAVKLQQQDQGHAAVRVVNAPTEWIRTTNIEKVPPNPRRVAAAVERITAGSEYTSPAAAVAREIEGRALWLEQEIRQFGRPLPAPMKTTTPFESVLEELKQASRKTTDRP